MARLTLRELHELGLAWPGGPVPPPDDEDASFDLLSEAIGCESLYHDYKGDTRYLDQKASFEALAKKVAARRGARPAPPVTAPITKRKLAALGLEWPWPYPFDLDDPLDLVAALAGQIYADNMDYVGGRASYLRQQQADTKAIIQRLDELGVEWRPNIGKIAARDVPPVAKTSPGFPAVESPKSEPPARSVTRRMLRDLGLALPFSPHLPFALDEPIDLEDVMMRLEAPAKEAVEEIARALEDPLNAVLARRDEIAPRLAYAARLGDGDPRAQFIRVQCEASQLPAWDPRLRVLTGRWIDLLVRQGRTWDAELDGLAKYKTYRRGFVEALDIDGDVFAKNAERILARNPIVEVRCTGNLEALARSPALLRLRSVRCEGDVAAMVTTPYARLLKSLWISNGHVGDALEVAASSNALPSLEELRVWAIEDVARIASALAKAPAFPLLDDVTLYGPPIDEQTLGPLMQSTFSKRVRKLYVRVATAGAASALVERELPSLVRLGVDGADAMPVAALASLRAPVLEELSVFESALGEAGALALAQLRLDRLRSFTMTGWGFDAAAFAALSAAAWLGGLETIALRGLASAGASAPLLARVGTSLRSLQLEAGAWSGLADALARSSAAASLVTLRVGREIDARELAATVARTPNLRGFELMPASEPPSEEQTKVLLQAGFEPCGGEKGCWVRHAR